MTTERSATAVRLRRTIAAPPERVYRAWLDPELMARWFAPDGFTVDRAEVDARVGGRLRIWHVDAEGNDVGGSESEIVELVPDERIVLAWQFVGPDRTPDPALASRLTITLARTDAGTELELVHERLDGLLRHRPEVGEHVEGGWASALDALVAVTG